VAPAIAETKLVAANLPSYSHLAIPNAQEIASLSDIQRYPDSGVAARYKRLGLSVRQGQKLKAQLLKDGLIEEQNETTKVGRLRVIRITEACSERSRGICRRIIGAPVRGQTPRQGSGQG
jgi:hypothetical protein